MGLFNNLQPDTIINCAAYTDVNRAEIEEVEASRINSSGVATLARACAATGTTCIHVSTDYVFDGVQNEPWETTSPTGPVNAYGRTKLAGEQKLAAILPPDRFAIVRTSWLYGAAGPNFVKTMLRLAREGKELKIIDDQSGAPTYTADLARTLIDIMTSNARGILHASNRGVCTWYEFAQEIFKLSDVHPSSLTPCSTSEYPTPALRPANSQLSPASLIDHNIELLPHWSDGLRRYLAETGELAIK